MITPNNMNISYRKENGTGHLFFEGELDLFSRKMVEQSIREASAQCDRIEIHLDFVDYLDSSGLSTLFCVARSLAKNNKKFKVTGANERIKNLFKIINFDTFLEKYDADNKINE